MLLVNHIVGFPTRRLIYVIKPLSHWNATTETSSRIVRDNDIHNFHIADSLHGYLCNKFVNFVRVSHDFPTNVAVNIIFIRMAVAGHL